MIVTILTLLLPLIPVLKTLGLAFVITRFEPLQMVLEDKIFNQHNNPKYEKYRHLLPYSYLVTCLKCSSFWLGIIIGGLWIGVLSFIIATIYDKYFSNWEKTIRLN